MKITIDISQFKHIEDDGSGDYLIIKTEKGKMIIVNVAGFPMQEVRKRKKSSR